MKRASEGQLGAALRSMDMETFVYKPPDDARNPKPADYLVWFLADPDQMELIRDYEFAFVEAKDTDAVEVFNLREIRPSQRRTAAIAQELGIPYWLCIYWRRRSKWTISSARMILSLKDAKSLTYLALSTLYGVDCTPGQLTATMRSALLGELFAKE